MTRSTDPPRYRSASLPRYGWAAHSVLRSPGLCRPHGALTESCVQAAAVQRLEALLLPLLSRARRWAKTK